MKSTWFSTWLKCLIRNSYNESSLRKFCVFSELSRTIKNNLFEHQPVWLSPVNQDCSSIPDSRSGHMPRLWVWSLVEVQTRGN